MRLRNTQCWLQSVIVSPKELDSPAISRRIAPSSALTPAERVNIYRDLYPARLVNALKTDYPLLFKHLGGPVFTQLALLYANAHPSRSFTLNEFGAGLPAFLAEVQGLRRPQFTIDLATFERACTEVFHAAEAAPLTADAIAAVKPEAWEHARLQPIPALRLLTLAYPVHQYAEGKEKLRRKDCALAIYRRNYQVHWIPLTAAGSRILASLCNGKTLGQSLTNSRGPAQTWFREWTAAGLFTRINTE